MLHNDLICSYELHLSKALHLVPRGLKYRAHVCSAALSLNHWLSISISISSPTSISTGTCPFLPCNPSYWLISRGQMGILNVKLPAVEMLSRPNVGSS